MDTRREIGKFTAYTEMTQTRVVVGGDRAFHGLDVILFEFSAASKEPFTFYETMPEVVSAALTKARQ